MPTVPGSSPALSRRRLLAGAACALVAVAFNVGVVVLADSASGLAVPPLTAAVDKATSVMLVLSTAPLASPPPAVHMASASARRSEAVHRSARPALSSRVGTLPVRLAQAMPPAQAFVELQFFRLGEVDEPAEPASDWTVDVATLDEFGVDRVTFELLVSDRGEIVNCALAAPLDLHPEVRQQLEARLRKTEMRPAVKEGSRVASYRRIELYVDVSDPFERG